MDQGASVGASEQVLPAEGSFSENRKGLALSVLGLCSNEQFTNERSGKVFACFNNLSFSVCANEVWGISSNEPVAVRTLCQTAGNMRGYLSGMLKYGSIATERSGRRDIPNLFYIDTHKMLQNDKTVLQQLVYASGKKHKLFGAAEMQSKMLCLLENTGLSHIALSQISNLFDTEKFLLELLLASESDSMLIVCDAVDYTFSKQEIEVLSNIAIRIRYLGKALVIGSLQPELIETVCDNTLFLFGGKAAYCGSVKGLNKSTDKMAFVIRDENSRFLGMLLSSMLPGWRVKVSKDRLYLYNHTDKPMSAEEFYSLLAKNRLSPDEVSVNCGSVANSFEELVERYDIQSKSI
jgi:ABC-type uncharacterized transport system ATPase subunit